MDRYIVFIVKYSVYVFMDRYMHAYIHEAAQLPPAPTILLACWFRSRRDGWMPTYVIRT